MSLPLAGQTRASVWLTGGVKLGAPINDPSSRSSVFETYTQSRWTGGPAVELHLPYRFAVEFDALYRTYRQHTSYPFPFGADLNPYQVTGVRKTGAWDLPLLLKYRFRVGALRPFVSAGYQWTRESSRMTAFYVCTGPQGSCKPPEVPQEFRGGTFDSSATMHGPVAGAGLEFRTRFVTITPEFRFTRPTHGYPRENRATGMVGFTFGRPR
ncbi:MAG: outer membrane beta-barrel protein [Acidobacteria bacterium]|nr:outer membrane beta-barrel protein [Acidobacteriota bacterium]